MKKHLILGLCLTGMLAASARPVELANAALKVQVKPENGGRITALSGNGVTLKSGGAEALGLGKNRVFPDRLEWGKQPWKILRQTAGSLTMRIVGVPAEPRLEITKTISLPKNGTYIKIENVYRNANPIAGSFTVVPWLHNAFPIRGGSVNEFYLAHTKGVEVVKASPRSENSLAIAAPGNWTAWLNTAENSGLLLVSEKTPEVLYNYISPKTGSLELLYPRLQPIPEASYTYYLAPIRKLDAASVAALRLPITPKPDVSAPRTAAKKIDLDRHFAAVNAKLPFEVKLPKSAYQISPEAALPVTFFVRRPSAKPAVLELEVDLPDGVETVAHTGNFWWFENEDLKLLNRKTFSAAGATGTRSRFALTCANNPGWRPHARLLLKASRPDAAGALTFRAFADGKEVSSGSVPLSTIRIPRAKAPRRFTAMLGVDYGLMQIWPEFTRSFHYFGANGVCLNYNVPNRKVSAEEVRKTVAELKKSGFTTAVMGFYFFAPPRRRPDLQTCDLNGKISKEFDFMRRGAWQEEVARYAADKGMTLGYDWVISDYEAYFRGERLGFTPEAEKTFRKYLSAKAPKLEWLPPRELARRSERHPEQYRHWLNFKAERFADYAGQAVKRARELASNPAPLVGWCVCPHLSEETMIADNMVDTRAFNSFLDMSMPMVYNNVYRSMPDFREQIELFRKLASGRRAKVIPTLTLGFREDVSAFPPEHNFFLLLETALLQCGGAYLWPGISGSDGNGMYWMSRALDLIADIEDFVHSARRADALVRVDSTRSSRTGLPVKLAPLVLTHGNKCLIYLADYSAARVDAIFEVQVPFAVSVRALHGKFQPKTLTPGSKQRITLEPGADKALLLELTAPAGKNFPAPQPDKAAVVVQPPPGTLFFDGFEGTTVGGNLYDHARFGFAVGGVRGKCLDLKNYEAAWILKREFAIPSGNATVELDFRPGHDILPGGKRHLEIFRCRTESGPVIVYIEPKSGKMYFSVGRKNTHRMKTSQTCRWAGDLWYKLRIEFGRDGQRLFLNGAKEIEIPQSYPARRVSDLQLGRRWVSFGHVDNLTLIARPDANKPMK